MAGATALAALRAAARECQLAAPSFNDEQAAQGLAISDELRARFMRPASSASLAAAAEEEVPPLELLSEVPAELMSIILSHLDLHDLARLAATCRSLCRDAPTPPPPPRAIWPVEIELRRRAEARGLDVGSSLPEGAASWVACLLKRDRRDTQLRQAPLAVGSKHSIFVDKGGRLLTCGRDRIGNSILLRRSALLLGHAVDPDADPNMPRKIGPPTPVPSMHGRRIVSVAAGDDHCLALSAEAEVYSWGDNDYGSLGHGDVDARGVPSRIESLSRIERIAVGPCGTSAAVDEDGRLFTWGKACFCYIDMDESGEAERFEGPSGLGYELDAEAMRQTTPKQVAALSQERVVGVALGDSFTLAVTDAGAVFFCGFSRRGGPGNGSLGSEVLPRRIEALTETGRRFVAVAAGQFHAFALTEEGELYGWGYLEDNFHRRKERAPQRVAALIGQRVKLVTACGSVSCAVTEKGELFIRGGCNSLGHIDLGRSAKGAQTEPTRVDRLSGVEVAAVAISATHTLAADAAGVVWAFGCRPALGLDALGTMSNATVPTPTPIPKLRVRVLNSP